MCGFVGFISPKKLIHSSILIKMNERIIHRGRDDFGYTGINYEKKSDFLSQEEILKGTEFSAGIGFRRLSIRDLSKKGHQPMFSFDKNICLVFNGEIYNTEFLRKIAESKGYSFSSNSDTEIILAIYLLMGLDYLLSYLDGMYAICIVDLIKEKFIFIRDHVGIKPLYFYLNNNFLLFSSETKSFNEFPGYLFEIERNNLDEFLLFRNDTLEGSTLQKNIFLLPPGNYVELPITNRDQSLILEPKIYYELPKWEYHKKANYKDISDNISISVRNQMLADVPVGCQLSGGTDSSLISHIASKINDDLKTFSIIFKENDFSEEKYIDYVSNRIKSKQYKNLILSDDFLELIERVTYHLDHPICHPSSIGVWTLAENASQYLKVLLSGEGADEVFGGYGRFFFSHFGGPQFNRFLRYLARKTQNQKLKLFGVYPDPYINYVSNTFQTNPFFIKEVMPDFSFESAISRRLNILKSCGDNFRDSIFDYEIKTYLPALLIRQDKMSMAHSIENRVPFLGREFINKIRSSTHYKYMNKTFFHFKRQQIVTRSTKAPLKKYCSEIFGDKFTYRPKFGFGFPLESILSTTKANEMFHDLVLPALSSYSIFDSNNLKRQWNSSLTNKEDLFSIFSLGIWLNNP